MNFFHSVDKANMEVHIADTEIVISFQNVSVVLNIHYYPMNVFVVSISGYDWIPQINQNFCWSFPGEYSNISNQLTSRVRRLTAWRLTSSMTPM